MTTHLVSDLDRETDLGSDLDRKTDLGSDLGRLPYIIKSNNVCGKVTHPVYTYYNKKMIRFAYILEGRLEQ